MGLNFDLNAASDEAAVINVVSKFDSCIDMTEEECQDYLSTGADPEMLKLKEGKTLTDCTLFVLKKNLDWRGHERLMKKQFEIDPVTKQPTPNPAFVMTDVQSSLVDIKNPEEAEFKVEFKRGSNGMASQKLVGALHNAGILLDLFQARAGTAREELR